jgi:hypothetical protein
MCVKRGFYRRLPAPELKQCSARGGVAQIMLEAATNDMQDSLALFGYCGDRQAFVVDTRAGYLPTLHPHLIVKWIADVPALRRREIEDRIAAVGPF